MGLFNGAQAGRAMRIFQSHYRSAVEAFAGAPGYTPLLSDYAQAFHVARLFVTKDVHLSPEVERSFIDKAIDFALPFSHADHATFVEAINIRLLAKNPKSNEHSRELRERMAALDAEYLTRRASG